MKPLILLCGEYIIKNKINGKYLTKESEKLIKDLTGFEDNDYLENVIRRGVMYYPFKLLYKYYKRYTHQDESLVNHAIQFNNIEFIKFYYEDLNKSNNLIPDCAYHGRINLIKYLIKRGYDPKYNNSLAIEWACENGHFRTVKYLVELGLKPHNNCIEFAAEGGYINVVIYLYKIGISITNETMLYAIENNHHDIVKFLVSKDFNIFMSLENYYLDSQKMVSDYFLDNFELFL